MNKTLSWLAVATLLGLSGLAACEPEDVGVPCRAVATGEGDTESGADVNSSAMDCRSRLCLFYGGLAESIAMCTRVCGNDGDCPNKTDSCTEGFTCIPATRVGSIPCCKLCVCKRFVTGSNAAVVSYCEQNPPQNCPD